MILLALIRGIKNAMKYDDLSFGDALKEEIHMMTRVMGFKLYVKYMNGIAKEGVDFLNG